MRPVGMMTRLAAVVLALTGAADLPAQVLVQRACRTVWQGQQIQGVMRIERLPYSDTHRIYGQFRDPMRNLIEFEVITNQPGGVGGMWFNNARHRETRIRLQFQSDRVFDIHGDAGSARYVCS